MKRVLTPTHLRLRPVARAIFCGVLVMGGVVALPTYAGDSVAANPAPVKRPLYLAAACNPCAAKKKACDARNPCAAKKKACDARNPCAAKKKACDARNPCAAKKTACGASNPCAAKRICNPCAAKKGCGVCNPCGGATVSAKAFMRPCGAGANPRAVGNLVKEGELLWKDSSLSSNGLACNTCHKKHAALNPTFAMTYPHKVAMPLKMAGVQQVNADEMIQFCMLVPMQAKILAWNSRELAALTAYTLELQKGYNPCAAKKSAGARYGVRNSCAAKKKGSNPCNPCAAKKNTYRASSRQ